ncbi:hypothetical protein QTG56_25385 (plasmid) [Rossellomorea sp. AcN35-11]|nr:hypothetical protein [Rossellomorea aquimaris]WJV31950.1 hypothetical protein QTG56_25385 [Rossellomorea sp. AcN35-11]
MKFKTYDVLKSDWDKILCEKGFANTDLTAYFTNADGDDIEEYIYEKDSIEYVPVAYYESSRFREITLRPLNELKEKFDVGCY